MCATYDPWDLGWDAGYEEGYRRCLSDHDLKPKFKIICNRCTRYAIYMGLCDLCLLGAIVTKMGMPQPQSVL